MARADISVNDKGEAWGLGDELLDGTVYFINGLYHYDTWRGRSAKSSSLRTVLTDVARDLGYSSARLVTNQNTV